MPEQITRHASCMNEERARKLMAKDGIDLLLANSVWNVAYLTGFMQFYPTWDGIQHFMDRNLWRDDAKPLAGFSLDPSKSTFLASNGWVLRYNYLYPNVRIVADDAGWMHSRDFAPDNAFTFPVLDWTLTALRERGLEAARIGYEATRLPAYYLQHLKEQLPRATFIPVDNLFWQIRAVKTPEEIRRLREAFRIATQVYKDTFAMMKPGVSFQEITRMQMARANEMGGAWYFNHLWVHPPGTEWCQPPDYRLHPGDEGGCDLGVYYQGYGTDFGRTVSLGAVQKEIRQEFDSLRDTYDAMCEVTKIGNTGADIYHTAKRYEKKHRGGRSAGCLGHGLGLEVHELPAVLANETDPIEENMVLQLEVGTIEPPRNTFIFLEDAGVITSKGWESLNDLPRDIAICG